MRTNLKSIFKLFVSLLLVISLVSCGVLDQNNEPQLPDDSDEETVIAHNITNPDNAKVGFYWADGTQSVANATWYDASNNELFASKTINWEPGFCKVYHIKVEVDEGSIAVNYRFDLVSKDGNPGYASAFDVYYIDPATQISGRNDLDSDCKIGTLASVLSDDNDPDSKKLYPGENAIVTIAVKMREDASSELQGVNVDCSVQLIVSRILPESDSFNDEYDG